MPANYQSGALSRVKNLLSQGTKTFLGKTIKIPETMTEDAGNQTGRAGMALANMVSRMGRDVLKRDKSVGFDLAMPDKYRPDETVDERVAADENPACVALVPLVASAPWSHPHTKPSRPNSSFVTHLIATAEQAPQTRTLRRASLADARTAYSANPRGVQDAGIRTRQTI